MKIHANHFSYDEPANIDNVPFNILMIYLANQSSPDFESYIPEWPTDEINNQKYIIKSKCYFDVNSLKNCVNFDLIILAVEHINQVDAQEINALLLKIEPKNTVLLYRNEPNYQAIQGINSYIRCDCNLLKVMFALGWSVATLCLYTNQLIGFDFGDFTEVVCQFKHGVLNVVDHTTQVSDYESLAQEALNHWQVNGFDTDFIAGLFCTTNVQFKSIDFCMADYAKIIALYHARFRALGVFPNHVFGVSVPKSSYQAYPFIQVTMFGTINQIEDNFSSHSSSENLKTNNSQKLDLPAFLRRNISEDIKGIE